MNAKRFNEIIILVCLLGMGICAILLDSCALPPQVDPVCRHEALYAAVSWGDLRNEPVRIAIGPTNKRINGTDEFWWHAQAQAKVNGKWEWLEMNCSNVVVGSRDDFMVKKYMSAMEFSVWLIRGNPNLFKGGLR